VLAATPGAGGLWTLKSWMTARPDRTLHYCIIVWRPRSTGRQLLDLAHRERRGLPDRQPWDSAGAPRLMLAAGSSRQQPVVRRRDRRLADGDARRAEGTVLFHHRFRRSRGSQR